MTTATEISDMQNSKYDLWMSDDLANSDLGHWLDDLLSTAEVCAKTPNYDNAVRLCLFSRRAWSAYFSRWGLNPILADAETTDRLRKALRKGEEAVQKTELAVKHDPKRAAEVGRFRENIEFRRNLLHLLHSPDGGPDAVKLALVKDAEAHV